MSKKLLALVAVAIIILAIAGFAAWRRFRPLEVTSFQEKWRDLQKLCSDKATWAEAIIDADKLLDEALRRRHIAGHTMGERLVKAQRMFTDNDSVWFGHKLRTKIEDDPETKLKETDVKEALLGIRQALKDLGALPANARSTENDQ